MLRSRQKWILAAIVLLAVITFFTGINWGLPSRRGDEYMFGGRQVWTGKQIMDLAGAWDESGPRGADIAMHPLQGRDQPIVLNDTDAKRAEIVRRYRLYSSQPDEMITFRSLSRMKPGKLDLDPRLYQYGGLWIFPIGGLLKLGSLAGIVTLRTDLAFYLDHPEAFARFYVVARSYAAVWGLLGVIAVYAVGREWTGSFGISATAAALFATIPVVIDLAHEAKPHLPGTVLTLVTIWAAMRYAKTGRSKWWIIAGISAGAAMAMVLTGYVAFAVLVVMTLLRPMAWIDRAKITAAAGLVGIAIFTLFDPYLPYNFLFHREVLHSNVGNYGTFYQPHLSLSALKMTALSIVSGMSIGPAMLGVCGIAIRTLRPTPVLRYAEELDSSVRDEKSCSSVYLKTGLAVVQARLGFLLLAPALLVLIQFILLADGKPAEYARFAVTLDVILAISAAAFIARLGLKDSEKNLAATLLVVTTLYFGSRYDIDFVADTQSNNTRATAAVTVDRNRSHELDVWAEPAPYCLPPVNLFDQQIVLLPRGADAITPGAMGVRAVDGPTASPADATPIIELDEPARTWSPISWANKPFQILSRSAVSPAVHRP